VLIAAVAGFGFCLYRAARETDLRKRKKLALCLVGFAFLAGLALIPLTRMMDEVSRQSFSKNFDLAFLAFGTVGWLWALAALLRSKDPAKKRQLQVQLVMISVLLAVVGLRFVPGF
jgi:hypothetical protein